MTALKVTFDQSDLLLSASCIVSYHSNSNYAQYDLAALSKLVDFIHFEQDCDWKIFKTAEKWLQLSEAQDMIEKLIKLGVAPAKIVLGIQLIGVGFGQSERLFDKFYQYNEVCSAQEKVYNVDSGLSVFKYENCDVVIEDSRSIANKVRFAVKRGLGGVAPTYLMYDDHSGVCFKDEDTFVDFQSDEGAILNIPTRTESTFPLLSTVNEAIRMTSNEINPRAIIPSQGAAPEVETQEPMSIEDTALESETLDSTSTTYTQKVTKDPKVVCSINKAFNYNSFNWLRCTHLISVDETQGGMISIFSFSKTIKRSE